MADNKPMTIEDLAITVGGLAQTIDSLAAITQAGLESVRKDMRTDFESVRKDMRADIESVRKDMRTGFEMLNQKIDSVDARVDHLETSMKHFQTNMEHQFEERTFTPEQKEDILAVVATANQQLAESTLGKENITFTRPEYDATAVAVDFPNRFTTPAGAFAD
jgi:chromosome segregation ATPase